jgi:hypothetical protein
MAVTNAALGPFCCTYHGPSDRPKSIASQGVVLVELTELELYDCSRFLHFFLTHIRCLIPTRLVSRQDPLDASFSTLNHVSTRHNQLFGIPRAG